MSLTPVEIRHITFGRGFRGYKRAAVERTLTEIADSFEDVWRDRADLSDKVEQLEHDLVRYRELETLLRATLVSAERAAHELRDQAKREAALIVGEAHAEARDITRTARAEYERLDAESTRIGSLLRSALATVGGRGHGVPEPAADSPPRPEDEVEPVAEADAPPEAEAEPAPRAEAPAADEPRAPEPPPAARPPLPRPAWEGEPAGEERSDRWEAA